MPTTKARRANGEGALYQRADGKWEAALYVGYGPNGRRKRRKAVTATKTEAKRRLAQMQGDIEKNLDIESEKDRR